jgi:hypothetical protein
LTSSVSSGGVFGDKIRFGVYSGPQHATFEGYLELWRRCEELGYDWLSVFDHFMPIVGDPDGPCFEGPTMLAAMAAHTTRVRVAILVTGVTYRHPAVTTSRAEGRSTASAPPGSRKSISSTESRSRGSGCEWTCSMRRVG